MAFDVREGMSVFSADGERLGKVIGREGSSLLIEKGFFFPRDYLCRIGDVRDVRDGEVILGLSKAQLEGTFERGAGAPAASAGDVAADARSELRVPLKEEQLDVQKRVKQGGGGVRITKEVVTERKHLEVPVTREEVRVERVPASGAAATSPADTRFERETVRVPVIEEEVTVTKRPVVKEEVRVSKQSRTEHHDVDETVRREKARIERDDGRPAAYAGDPDIDRKR